MAAKRLYKVHFYVLREEFEQLKKNVGPGMMSVWFRNILHLYLKSDKKKQDRVIRKLKIEKGIMED